MNYAEILLAAALITPLAALSSCVLPAMRRHMPALLALAPLPTLVAAALVPSGTTVALPPALFGFTFTLDGPAAILLGASALLWIAAGISARTYLQEIESGAGFAAWWLATLAGNVGVLLAADLVSFYLFFTLVSLPAYGLIVRDSTQTARRAGSVYVSLTVLCEAFLILAFVLLAAGIPDDSLLIGDAVAALAGSPWRDGALAFLILGFGLKIGLVPWHVWMPLAYSAAPIPAASVLSGAAVKAGVIGLIRFLPFDDALPGWGETLAVIGLISAFYGVAIGLTQPNPKTVLAYSSVSQMGLLAAVLGMGLAAGDRTVAPAAAFYAMHHVLAKGGLFLCLAISARAGASRVWLVFLPAAALALGLAGLPLTGGALAKLAVKSPLGDGVVGTLATLSAVGSTLLMLHFLRCLRRHASHDPATVPSPATLIPWLAIALASVVLPWLLFPQLAGMSWHEVSTPAGLWSACWPVLIGGMVAFLLRAWRLPHLPEGDVLVASQAALRAARDLGTVMEGIDRRLRQWSTAGIWLLTCALLMVGTLVIGR